MAIEQASSCELTCQEIEVAAAAAAAAGGPKKRGPIETASWPRAKAMFRQQKRP